MAIKDQNPIIEQSGPIVTQTADHKQALDSRATAREGTHQIGLAVFVPKRAGIDPALGGLYQKRFGPRANWLFRLNHVDSVIRVRIKNVEFAVVISNRRRPNTVSVLRPVVYVQWRLPRQRMADDFPVDQVAGMKNWQTRCGVETGRYQIKVFAYADDVWIRIVRIQDRIVIGAVTIIGYPNF